ncbi:MAG: ECF-type sigma factor [Planctomycetota bacterium]
MCDGKPDSLDSLPGMNTFDPQIGSITELLRRIESGDTGAREELFGQVYSRLKALARPKLRGANRELLQTTAVVNEACGRMVKNGTAVSARNRAELFSAANRAIQWVLIDYARKRLAQKRMADRDELIEDAIRRSEEAAGTDFIDLQESLGALREQHERVARVIEARFFGGLTMQQAAELCGVSIDTAKRDWRFGRAFLHARLSK